MHFGEFSCAYGVEEIRPGEKQKKHSQRQHRTSSHGYQSLNSNYLALDHFMAEVLTEQILIP